MKEKRRLTLFVILAVMVIGGVYFSAGSVAGFFMAVSIEAACTIGLLVLLAYVKNESKRNKKTLIKNSKTYKAVDRSLRQPESREDKKKRANTYESVQTAGKSIEKKFDWTVEDNNTKVPVKAKDKASDIQNDLKTQVANWSKLVDYSGTVFNRMREQSAQQVQIAEITEEADTGMSLKNDIEVEVDAEFSDEAEEVEGTDLVKEEEDYAGFDISEDEWNEDTETSEENVETCISVLFDEQADDENHNDNSLEPEEDSGSSYNTAAIAEERKKIVVKGLYNSKNKLHVRPQPKSGKKPPIELLKASDVASKILQTDHGLENNAKKLIETLASFGVGAKIINISKGPSVTRYELQPDYGVKVSKIVNLTDDIALNLAATGVRIEAPIPGKAAIGIEIPNKDVTPVFLRDVIESNEFRNHPSKLAFSVGKDITGNVVIADIAKMPHLLIAGATGSGKSVCINTLITSILYKASPEEVKLLMVDPKVVELSIYNGIPHLLIPVVTDPKKAAGALNWAVQEMTIRYKLFADNSVRDLKGYNHLMRERGESILPQIVIIIDELADLMMVAANEVEDCICRLAQMARAAGMHLVIATQRPSVDVITGVIKANVPSRISFAVSSQIDSRTILDMAGAEKLLGRGDMLFNPLGMAKPLRVQGGLITDKEVESIVSFIKSNYDCVYDEEVLEKIDKNSEATQLDSANDDELLPQVINMVIEQGQASTSLLQRKFKLGYSRAARIVDQMEANGIVGPFEGSKPRKVLITKQQWMEMN